MNFDKHGFLSNNGGLRFIGNEVATWLRFRSWRDYLYALVSERERIFDRAKD
jgi:hypothetical protein